MFYEKRAMLFERYNEARQYFIENPTALIRVERYMTMLVNEVIDRQYPEMEHDYNEASYLHAFWASCPPENRGRAPIGDQIPWIEVGEHAVGHKIARLLAQQFEIHEPGLPSGADNRVVLVSSDLLALTGGLTDRVFLFLDIKSVGPRDNFDHTVVSPYQISGDGLWDDPKENLVNSPMVAQGRSVSHIFYPAIPPLYILTDGSVAPTVQLFVKPVYQMLAGDRSGQPLACIKNICLPNGLLLTQNPNYLKKYKGLLYPGKDDRKKDPRKIRVRVSFPILRDIAPWRVTEFHP